MQKNLSLILHNQRFFAFQKNIAVVNQTLATRLQNKPYIRNFRDVLSSRSEPVYQPDGVHLLAASRETVVRQMARVLEQHRWH